MDDLQSERIALLQHVRFFAGADPAVLPVVAAALEPVHLAQGAQLFQKGDHGDCLYIIVHGLLRVHDGELLFNTLGPGDVVGEMAALDAAPRSATVTAELATDLLELREAALYALIERNPLVARGMIHVLATHLRNRVSDLIEDFAYIRQVQIIAAAAQAMHDGTYRAELLHEVVQREDALGQLARTFQQMADEVIARERHLRREVQALRIEIDHTRQRTQVAEITDSDYFRQLQQRAAALRATFGDDPPDPAA